nr:hypothetical protein [Desulfobulbaceae bacterium]
MALSLLLLGAVSCSMLLQPTTSFDRRRTASSYGEILSQSNPDCDDCTDRFLVQKPDGEIITLIFRYNGEIKIIN